MAKQKIKVIHVAHSSHTQWAGKESKPLKGIILGDWFSLTAQQIKKFHPELEVECWCPEKTYKKQKEFIDSGVRYRQFPTVFSPMYAMDLSLEMLRELKKEIKKAERENYKLIIQLHEYHNLHGLVIATLFKKYNLIGQHHGGSWPIKHLKQTKRYKIFFLLFMLGQVWENLVIKNISYYYPLSKDETEYLKNKAPNSKIRFQTMGIDNSYFVPMKRDVARKKLKLPQDKKIILYIGRVNFVKGVRYLVKAMEKLKDVDLKIIGWGEKREEIENYVKTKKMKNVEFVGSVFGDKKLHYLSAVDAYVLPSTKEGASVSVMEAMARNLPIVTTDTGGMPLMVKTGREGILIEQRNPEAIAKAVRKILSWKKKNIRKYAQRYKWKKIVYGTVEDYKNINNSE